MTSRYSGQLVRSCFPMCCTREHASAVAIQNGNFALLCDRMGEYLYAERRSNQQGFSFERRSTSGGLHSDHVIWQLRKL